jgi:hypothetical protein
LLKETGALLNDDTDLETHEIINDAPFTFAACMLVMDDNKVSSG